VEPAHFHIWLKADPCYDSIRGAPRYPESLASEGIELAVGDLKDPESLNGACRGASAVISTASSTFSRQAGDSIETVDRQGQRNAVDAASRLELGVSCSSAYLA
jgi:uncharacterized protein YbjT (DUF2867 family)